jgi:uncharacterized Rmd1/YagE family protein
MLRCPRQQVATTAQQPCDSPESIHQKLSAHAATIRLEALEWVVIALIATEIVLGLLQ